MFRKAIVVLALIAASALFIGAAPTPASAANCTASAGGLKNSAGQINYVAGLYTCTNDVDQVRFKYNVCDVYSCTAGDYTYYSGAYDYYTYSAWVWMYLDHQGGNYDQTKTVPHPYNGATVLLIRNCWWSGGASLPLDLSFWYQIHNSSGSGSWGIYHKYVRPVNDYVTC